MNSSEIACAAIERATAALAMQRPQHALAAAGQAVTTDPANYRGFAVLCSAYIALDRWTEAQKAAEDGLALAPESDWLHRLRFLTLYAQERFEEALAAAEQAVVCAPEVANGHHCRSMALGQLGHFTDAVEAVEQALALDPEEADYHQHLGTLYLNRKPEVAEVHLRRAAAINPDNAALLNNLGYVLHKQKKDKAAMAAFKAAVLIDPTLKVAKENLVTSVKQHLKFGSVILLSLVFSVVLRGVLAGEKWTRASTAPPIPWAQLLIGGGILIFFIILIIAVAKWWLFPILRSNELKREDPQLFQVYKKLVQDQKAKRL